MDRNDMGMNTGHFDEPNRQFGLNSGHNNSMLD